MTSYRSASKYILFFFSFFFSLFSSFSELGFLAADFFLSFSLLKQSTINGLLLVY